ncbi:GspH/FimT family pseudopilin [Thiohalobacter sp. IOR34]|uniref:GspH/FimT family pseudopilin n=1 Tax=Thiohalobacter sp. IOR34 TaxID=3057176 RepID=UPI0025AFE6B0|nr:GspH/FimT family pseudopilin [Thiohalobacter sp. IOR34]WJW75085.1 GspH/FimT family pseudopilin [Thiohalobacter sp. IOR34]
MIRDDRGAAGFTLVELMLTVAVLAILLGIAVPGLRHFIDSHRLRAAAETLAADLQYARTAALRRGGQSDVYVSFLAGSRWCYGLGESPCDCRQPPSAPGACRLQLGGQTLDRRLDHRRFPGIRLDHARFGNSSSTRFEALRGIARPGRLRLQGASRQQLEIRLSLLGRVRLCHPRGQPAPAGYSPC